MNPLAELARKLFFSRLAVFFVAFSLSFAALLLTHSYIIGPVENHFNFGWETGRVAAHLAAGEGYVSPLPAPTGPTALVPPVYPLLMVAVFKLFGIYSAPSALVLLTLNCVFSGLTAVLLCELGGLVVNSVVGALAGWAWAFYPYAEQVNTRDIWETSLTTCLIVLLVLLAFRIGPKTSLLGWLGYGALCGFTTLSNTSGSIVSLILWAWLFWRLLRDKAEWFRPLALTAVGFILLLTPWWIRNYAAFGKFVPLRTNFWMEVWTGNCFNGVIPGHGQPSDYFDNFEYHSPVFWANDRIYPNSESPSAQRKQAADFARLGEIQYMALKRRETLACMASDPAEFAQLSARRVLFTWTSAFYLVPDIAAHYPLFMPVWIAGYTSLSLLAFFGLYLLFRRDPAAAMPFALLLLLFPGVYYLSHQTLRYRYPIDPEIILLAAITAYFALQKFRPAQPQ